MMWGEFKAWVESRGVRDEDRIAYIDWSTEPEVVHRDEESGEVVIW